jgi:sec-independent protein translocase protein TatC
MLLYYFFEIRNRFIFLSFCWIISAAAAYYNKETLLFLIVKSNAAVYYNKSFYFIATNITDLFSMYLELSYFVALQLTVIFGLFQLKSFFLPALYPDERKKFILVYRICLFFWLFSLIFLNKIVLPFCWKFFSSFFSTSNYTITIFLEIKATEYLLFYITAYYTTILIGQGFVLLFLLLNLKKEKLKFIKTTRKSFYFIFFLIATILTPPDITSQLFLGGTFILIYEVIIIIVILKNLS